MPQNGWQLGTLYWPGGTGFGAPNGRGFGYTQPGGVGTIIIPQQTVDPSSSIAPFSTAPVSNQTGIFAYSCGHICMSPVIVRDYDYTVGLSVALVLCSICSYVNAAVYPYQRIFDNLQYPVILP